MNNKLCLVSEDFFRKQFDLGLELEPNYLFFSTIKLNTKTKFKRVEEEREKGWLEKRGIRANIPHYQTK